MPAVREFWFSWNLWRLSGLYIFVSDGEWKSIFFFYCWATCSLYIILHISAKYRKFVMQIFSRKLARWWAFITAPWWLMKKTIWHECLQYFLIYSVSVEMRFVLLVLVNFFFIFLFLLLFLHWDFQCHMIYRPPHLWVFNGITLSDKSLEKWIATKWSSWPSISYCKCRE